MNTNKTAMTSTAAQSVLDAFRNASDGEYVEGAWVVNERTMLAAALRAVVSECLYTDDYGSHYIDGDELLAIATELEAN
jgi:uncharacterized protein YukJ